MQVRSEDEGSLGSWHAGTVIACGQQGRRHVKYDHLLADDCSDYLVEVVAVSPILDGLEAGRETLSDYRGNIRPLQPLATCGKSGLHYGLCVDVYHEEAWWEGVIFDHDEGSDERQIFFPDIGDELKVGVDTLRITHDWDEATGTWQRRGTWIFLELIEQYEQECRFLAVSVKQIWYDVRVKEGFQRLREWTSNMRDLWEELVLQVIDDNFNITVEELCHKLEGSGCLLPQSQVVLEPTQPSSDATDVNVDHKKEEVETRAIKPVRYLSNSYGLIDHEANEKDVLDCSVGGIYEPVETCDLAIGPNFASLQTSMDKLVPIAESDGPSINPITDSTISDREKPIFELPVALSASPSNFDGHSHGASVIDSEGVPKDSANNPKCSTCRSRVEWTPVGSTKLLGVEFCPYVVDQYCAISLRKSSNSKLKSSVKTGVLKHLSYLGWKIDYRRDNYNKKMRYRYTSPDGKAYDSLYQACKHLKYNGDLVSSTSKDDKECSHASSDNQFSSRLILEQPQESQNPDSCSQSVVTPHSRLIVKPKFCPRAVEDYYLHELEKSCNKEVKGMRLKAMKHLSALGWVFWCSNMGQKNDLYYESPSGRMYFSLQDACKGYLDGVSNFMSVASSLGPIKSINMKGSQLTSSKPTSVVYSFNFQENLGPPSAPSKRLSGEPSSLVRLNKSMELSNVKRFRKLRRKRCDNLLDDEPLMLHMRSNLFAAKGLKGDGKVRHQKDQIATLPKLKRRKTSRPLIKLKDGPKTSLHHNPRSVLSWLIDNKVLLPRMKVSCLTDKDGSSMKKGWVTTNGIKCSCCQMVFSLSSFEAHAAGKTSKRPASNIYLKDGRSLFDCQMQMIGNGKMPSFTRKPNNRMKGNWVCENDYICSVCHYGGELMLCDQCPSSFHKNCLGLKVDLVFVSLL